jgi:chromate reductase, NAD(P)H dehydrogenase (quinone)
MALMHSIMMGLLQTGTVIRLRRSSFGAHSSHCRLVFQSGAYLMSSPKDVAVFVGSLRKDSFNRKTANALAGLAPDPLKLAIVEIGQLSLYSQDDDVPGKVPSPWQAFRDRIKPADAVLFVTPEYNRSVPGVLKNAIDVGSRPHRQSVWDGKPGAVISVSPGAIGGFGANHHLRQMMVFLNVPMLQQPEAYVGDAGSLFDDKGNLTNAGTREFLGKFMQVFAAWIERNGKK